MPIRKNKGATVFAVAPLSVAYLFPKATGERKDTFLQNRASFSEA
jgi:hypothetical protein